jgi:hypothetical protein
MNFYNEIHTHHQSHHLNLDAVESFKLMEKTKARKIFPLLFAGGGKFVVW